MAVKGRSKKLNKANISEFIGLFIIF